MTLRELLFGDVGPERVVPPSGFTMTLTLVAAAAMAFIAVFMIAVANGAERLGESWTTNLTGTATIRLAAAEDAVDAAVIAQLLDETPGIAEARQIDDAEQSRLLAPWLGEDLPLDLVRLPILFEVTLTEEGPDESELKARLTDAAPGSVYDNHETWSVPVAEAANRLSGIAAISVILVGVITSVMIWLAASASLSANGQVIDVLRLVGATDGYITRVFVRRFALRAAAGASLGSLFGLLATLMIPDVESSTGLMSVGFEGAGWLWPFIIPLLAGVIAYFSTRAAATRRLREVS